MITLTQLSNSMLDNLNDYISELTLSKSKTTVDAYRYDVSKFLDYLSNKNVKRVSTIKPHQIVAYLAWCKDGGKSDSTLNRYYMSIKSFFNFLRRNKLVDNDITQDVTAPKYQLTPPKILSLEEAMKILDSPDTTTWLGIRDKAILELLYSSGLRASELCNLEISDFNDTKMLVKSGKGSKTRTVPVTQQASYAIKSYIKNFRGNEEGYLFLTKNFRQLKREKLSQMVGRYAKRNGINKVTTHTLRHACATHLLEQGADIRLIQEILGHSSITSTQRYTHLSSLKIEDMFNKFHPRKKNENKIE